LSALVSLIGAFITLVLSSFVSSLQMILVPIAAGGFIYVAGSDLIPELHKESGIKTSIIQVVSFIIGILIMASLLVLG
jgi:zinc and cadmium transporter